MKYVQRRIKKKQIGIKHTREGISRQPAGQVCSNNRRGEGGGGDNVIRKAELCQTTQQGTQLASPAFLKSPRLYDDT
jgi:hypothetical protein